MSDLLIQSTRVALAAYLHDLGKFSQRAGVNEDNPRLKDHIQLYCPRVFKAGVAREQSPPTHLHAAHTALSFELLEKHFQSLLADSPTPFSKSDVDSLVNVASRHHIPETFLDWVVARADRLASGFERERFETYNLGSEDGTGVKNYRQARLLNLFEQVHNYAADIANVSYVMPLTPLSPQSIFPESRKKIFPATPEQGTAEYKALWKSFIDGIGKVNQIARSNPTLALDSFDTLWCQHTHCIPSATVAPLRPDVSLYDHSRTTAALAVALWRWHSSDKNQTETIARAALANEDMSEMEKKKFILIQGDFTGIQNFIFGATPRVSKKSADTLRGKSFFVNLLCESVSISILNALDLPPVCQVMNAAGKFLIVAPNTDDVRLKIKESQENLDKWFIEKTLGIAGVVIAALEVSQADFLLKEEGTGFRNLMTRLFESLELAKLKKFSGGNSGKGSFGSLSADYSKGACDIDTRLPAETDGDEGGIERMSFFGRDMLTLGKWLRRTSDEDVLVIHKGNALINQSERLETEMPSGIRITLIERGRVNQIPQNRFNDVLRIWDYKLPDDANQNAWNGFAHKQINAWAPWSEQLNQGLTFEDIAAANVRVAKTSTQDSEGIEALAVIKGDVDNLGELFRKGLHEPTFAKMASLSRQLNSFFAHWLPVYCREHPEFSQCYTLFAGGDDFFLIAPWRTGQQLAKSLRDEFCRYTAQDPEKPKIHLSVGILTAKAGTPVGLLSEWAEDALSSSKAFKRVGNGREKDSVTIFSETIGWEEFPQLDKIQHELIELDKELGLPTAWYYTLLEFLRQAGEMDRNPANNIWKAHLSYSTARFIERVLKRATAEQRLDRTSNLIKQQLGWLMTHESRKYLKIALYNHVYSRRKS